MEIDNNEIKELFGENLYKRGEDGTKVEIKFDYWYS